jgi:hypothetical protein
MRHTTSQQSFSSLRVSLVRHRQSSELHLPGVSLFHIWLSAFPYLGASTWHSHPITPWTVTVVSHTYLLLPLFPEHHVQCLFLPLSYQQRAGNVSFTTASSGLGLRCSLLCLWLPTLIPAFIHSSSNAHLCCVRTILGTGVFLTEVLGKWGRVSDG